MLLPGPEAQQLAVYIGWLLNGLRGGLAAGILFVLPGMVALLALSAIYVAWGDATAVTAIFAGLAPAVVAVVAQAVLRVGARALSHPALLAVAVGAFLALALFGVPFPLVVGAAAGIGWLLGRFAPHTVSGQAKASHDADGPPPLIPDQALHAERPSLGRTARILVVGLLVWAAPLAAVALLTGTASTLTSQGLFFSGTALVTFGGAYAVLAYVAQRAVETYGWLSAGEMVRGLALAETTPGPLIMVVQFVAFLGAYHHPDPLSPWAAALVGALLTTWVTFVPCFLFIFLGAPYVERLRGNHSLSAALTGITAAVVGVIANLALYFAVHTLFAASHPLRWGPVRLEVPELASLRPVPLAIAVAALVMIFRLRWSVPRTLVVCAGLGLAAALTGLPVS
jgi:chromate transporter